MSVKKCCLHDSSFIFSTPTCVHVICSGRAIVLPPALTLALHQPPQMLKFCVKVFRTSLFPNPMMDLMHIDTGPKFYTVSSPPPNMTLRSRSQT